MAVDLYGQRLKATVNVQYAPNLVDTALLSNVVAQRVIRAAGDFGGRTYRQPVQVTTNSGFTTFRGLQALPTSAQDNFAFMEYDPSFATVDVTLPGDEININGAAGDSQVLNLIKTQFESQSIIMADNIGSQFYTATGTGTDFVGLAAGVDDGSSVSTIGNLSRTTYATLASTVTASSGTLTLAKMDTLWNNTSKGMYQPTIIPVTKAVRSLYEQLARTYGRLNQDVEVSMVKAGNANIGYKTTSFKGVPVVVDDKVPTGVMFFLNEKFIDFKALPLNEMGAKPVSFKSTIKGTDYSSVEGLGFSMTDWMLMQNAFGYFRRIFFSGQFIYSNPRTCGKLTGITGI